MKYAALGLFALTTAFLWVRMAPFMSFLDDPQPDPRTRRLIFRRGFHAIGAWQISIGIFEFTIGYSGIMLIGVGIVMFFAAHALWFD